MNKEKNIATTRIFFNELNIEFNLSFMIYFQISGDRMV